MSLFSSNMECKIPVDLFQTFFSITKVSLCSIVSQLLAGRTLNEIINEKPLNVKRALEIIRLKPKFAVFDIIKIEIRIALECR